jgi:hypothetical protein
MTMTTVERTAGSAVALADSAEGAADGAVEGADGSGVRSGVWDELTAEA